MNVISVSKVFSSRSKWNAVPLTALFAFIGIVAEA